MKQQNNEANKIKILKGINKRLRRRNILIAAVSVIICAAIGIGVILSLPPKVVEVASGFPTGDAYGIVPFADQEILTLSDFRELENELHKVKVYTKIETINELDDRALPYNHVYMPQTECANAFHKANSHYHIENQHDGTAKLYFYQSNDCLADFKREDGTYQLRWGKAYVDILFGRHLCAACVEDMTLNEITEVYYLIYDFETLDAQKFEAAKKQATLIWSKS